MGHGTCGMGHMIRDRWGGCEPSSKFHLPFSFGLGMKVFWRYFQWNTLEKWDQTEKNAPWSNLLLGISEYQKNPHDPFLKWQGSIFQCITLAGPGLFSKLLCVCCTEIQSREEEKTYWAALYCTTYTELLWYILSETICLQAIYLNALHCNLELHSTWMWYTLRPTLSLATLVIKAVLSF